MVKYRYLSCGDLVWYLGMGNAKQPLESNRYSSGSSLVVWKSLLKYCLTRSLKWAASQIVRDEKWGPYTEVLLAGTEVSPPNIGTECVSADTVVSKKCYWTLQAKLSDLNLSCTELTLVSVHTGAQEVDLIWDKKTFFLSAGFVASWSSGLCAEVTAKRTQEVCLLVCFLNSFCLVSALVYFLFLMVLS